MTKNFFWECPKCEQRTGVAHARHKRTNQMICVCVNCGLNFDTWDNPPRRGKCSYCDRQSVRLLNPPLVEIPISLTGYTIAEAEREGGFWWSPDDTPMDYFELMEVQNRVAGANAKLIGLAPEAYLNELYCYLCFNGHIWPALRPYVVNIPPEMQFDSVLPWADPKWVSMGREKIAVS